jgi:hypothetical protein
MDFPLLSLEDLPAEFDYASFMDEVGEDDADYLAEESSASASTTAMIDPMLSQAFTPSSVVLNKSLSPPSRQRLERRGHTKSRRGCFNCKRRRIKVTDHPPR